MLRNLRHLWRLIGIARCLARHNALFPLERLPLRTSCCACAPVVAPGRPGAARTAARARACRTWARASSSSARASATRSDLLGQEVAADLSQLQDDLPPFDGALARQMIETHSASPSISCSASSMTVRSPPLRSPRSTSP